MLGVLALAAEYELELRAERRADGIAAAWRRQADGRMLPGKKHIGRPAVTGPAALQGLIADGKSVTEAARTLKIGRSTAYAALAATPRLTRTIGRQSPGSVQWTARHVTELFDEDRHGRANDPTRQ